MSDEATARLQILYRAYRKGGCNYMLQGPEVGTRWRELLDGLVSTGERVTREHIRAAWDSVHDGMELEIRNAFLLTMFWGYGNLFFGPRNTRLAIQSLDKKGWSGLVEVRGAAHLGAEQGIEKLSDLSVAGLRLSFQTKILYAMTGTIPILDRHTRSWLRQFEISRVDESDNDVSRVNEYVELCQRWSQQVGDGNGLVVADQCLIEYLMFWDAKRGHRRSVRQSPAWLTRVDPWR